MKYISKKDFTILLGNAVDHFDTSLYVFIAPTLAPIFFPHDDPIVELILAYSILATSIVTRPVGTYIFGIIARLYGASAALSYSLIGVGLATMSIGFLPVHHSIGFFAPLLLILFRVVRDIFSAGESAIAKLYILQDKEEKEAFKGSYLYQISTIFGMVIASCAATIVQFLELEFAWRFCYIFGGVAAIIGCLIRNNVLKIEKNKSKKVLEIFALSGFGVLWNHKTNVLRIAIVNSFSHLTYVIPFITMNHIVPLITDIEMKTMMVLSSFLLVFDLITIPIIGIIISRFSARSVMLVASCVLAITIIPLWLWIDDASLFYITFVRVWIVIWGIIFLCPLNLWCSQQVLGDEKYIVVGIGGSLGASVIGKLTPSICLALFYYTNTHMSVALYIAVLFTLTAFVIKSRKA
jgi:MFS family permease